MTKNYKTAPREFIRKTYQRPLGRMRVELLFGDLEQLIKKSKTIKHILDVGAGHAPVTARLLKRFPRLSAEITDPSPAMLGFARSECKRLGIHSSRVTFNVANLNQLSKRARTIMPDLLICHAVLNWTPKPYRALATLHSVAKINHSSFVSVVVGSTVGYLFEQIRAGHILNARKIAINPDASVRSTSYPNMTLKLMEPERFVAQVMHMGDILLRRGVRCFADAIPSHLLQKETAYLTTLSMEKKFGTSCDYWRLGNMLHVIYTPHEN